MPNASPKFPIAILCDDGELLVVPEERRVPPGIHVITWIPTNADVTAITFDDPNPPFTPPAKQPNGHWISTDTNENQGPDPQPWKYTVTATCPQGGTIVLDPEIVNEPPPPPEKDKDKDKDKDRGRGSD